MHELSEPDAALLSEVAPGFTVREWRGVGLSGHRRLCIDTAEGPWFVKIGPPEVLAADVEGDKALRAVMSARSLPELLACRSHRDACLIAYRFVEDARDLDRIDGKAGAASEILTALSAAHGTGSAYVRAPEIRGSRIHPAHWPDAMKQVKRWARRASEVRVPVGLIHGDLHGRNILVTPEQALVIDFTSVGQGCVWKDYARLETSLVVRGKGDPEAVAELRRLRDKHGARAGLSAKEIRAGYRGYLGFQLGSFWLKKHPDEARRRALDALAELC